MEIFNLPNLTPAFVESMILAFFRGFSKQISSFSTFRKSASDCTEKSENDENHLAEQLFSRTACGTIFDEVFVFSASYLELKMV